MTTQALSIGTTLREDGAYSISEILGKGGFGITYKATDLQLGRPVAIKEFFPANFCYRQGDGIIKMPGFTGVFDFDSYRDNFFDEAKRLVKLNHPNIVKIYDAFKANNTAYFVMEFEEGRTLQEILTQKVYLTESETITYIKDVAHALEYIHKQSILHRDIKPSNIIIRTTGKPVLIDFGAAREVSDGHEEHTSILSHGFAPLEQYRKDGQKGPFIDVYGLAATCYYCLTGSIPIRADHRSEKVMPAPNEINPRISDELNSILIRGLELDSNKRYQTISKFLYDLTSVPVHDEEDYDLTESQKKSYEIITQFIEDDETNALILTGVVNTGKTTLIKKILSSNDSNLAYKLLTVGSRVAEQLMHHSGLEAFSIYRHIYNFSETVNNTAATDSIDLDSGESSEKDIKQDHYSIKVNGDGERVVYIIEESQLLSDSFSETELFIFGSGKLLNDLIQFIDFKSHPKRKLLIVGDDKRLLRGSYEESSLSKNHLVNTYQLKTKVLELEGIIYNEQQRNILDAIKHIGSSLSQNKFNLLTINEDGRSIFKINREDFLSRFQKLDSVNQTIFLTYSNKHALEANLSIRRDCLNRTSILEKGDIVVFNNTVPVSSPPTSLFQVYIYKGEIAEILSVDDQEIVPVPIRGKGIVNLVFRKVKIFIPRYQKEEWVIVLENYLRQEKDISKEERQALLIKAKGNYKRISGKNKADKIDFSKYLKTDSYYNSALVKYAYSMTCHRANGAKWKYVFVNCETDKAKDNEEYHIWLYTAISCARTRIYLINFSGIHPNHKLEWKDRLDVFGSFEKPSVNVLNANLNIEIPEALLSESLKFKFPNQFPSLKALWYLVSSKLSAYQILVKSIEHHNYQELYTFVDENGQTVKIRFYFNGDGKITRHMLAPKNEFSEKIIRVLEAEAASINADFPDEFLKVFYHNFNQLLASEGIQIASLEHDKFLEHYLIVRDQEFVQLAVYYNGDGFITTVMPSKFNSHTLYQKVKSLVELHLRFSNAQH
jgi:serine/threonine protein kinase